MVGDTGVDIPQLQSAGPGANEGPMAWVLEHRRSSSVEDVLALSFSSTCQPLKAPIHPPGTPRFRALLHPLSSSSRTHSWWPRTVAKWRAVPPQPPRPPNTWSRTLDARKAALKPGSQARVPNRQPSEPKAQGLPKKSCCNRCQVGPWEPSLPLQPMDQTCPCPARTVIARGCARAQAEKREKSKSSRKVEKGPEKRKVKKSKSPEKSKTSRKVEKFPKSRKMARKMKNRKVEKFPKSRKLPEKSKSDQKNEKSKGPEKSKNRKVPKSRKVKTF